MTLQPTFPAPSNKLPPNDAEQDEEGNTLVFPASSLSNLAAPPVRKYGKSWKIVDNSRLTLLVGPDFFCFLPTFLMFALISYFFIGFMERNSKSPFAIVAAYVVCLGHNLAYLAVGLSDPGIAHPLTASEKNLLTKTNFCRKCRFEVPSKSYHCSYCDVCIMGYDHHCPWTSKCIGRNNLYRFYCFLLMTPVLIVFLAFAFGITMQDVAEVRHNLRKAAQEAKIHAQKAKHL